MAQIFILFKCVKNKKYDTKSSGVTVVIYTLWRFLWSITVHTHTENVIYLIYTIKIQMVYWRIFWGMKKEKQVCCRGFDVICVCVIDHGQQPMKMHPELQKSRYCINFNNSNSPYLHFLQDLYTTSRRNTANKILELIFRILEFIKKKEYTINYTNV